MNNYFERWAAIPIRAIVGFGFIAHGYAKLANGPEHFIGNLQALGIPAPELAGWLTIIVEVVGGIAVMIGAFVPLASLPLAAIMLVAAFTVHLQYGFSSIKFKEVTAAGPQFGPPGYEMALFYIACLATLVFGGSGPLSIDGYLKRRKEERK
jgi:putative oxidoreductase